MVLCQGAGSVHPRGSLSHALRAANHAGEDTCGWDVVMPSVLARDALVVASDRVVQAYSNEMRRPEKGPRLANMRRTTRTT
jgi:hypothetical protein